MGDEDRVVCECAVGLLAAWLAYSQLEERTFM